MLPPKYALPPTESFCVGEVVAMPTLPVLVITISSSPPFPTSNASEPFAIPVPKVSVVLLGAHSSKPEEESVTEPKTNLARNASGERIDIPVAVEPSITNSSAEVHAVAPDAPEDTWSLPPGAAVPIPTLFVEKSYTSPLVSIARPPARVEVAFPFVATRYAPANLPVVVALVPVAFTKVKFWRVEEPVAKRSPA